MRCRDPLAASVSPFPPQKQRFFRRAKDDTEKMSVHLQMFASFAIFDGIIPPRESELSATIDGSVALNTAFTGFSSDSP